MARFSRVISTIDTHAAGEPARIILSGLPPIPGHTMAEKFKYVSTSGDFCNIRQALLWEPRGHSGMFGVILTSPCHPEAQWGLLPMGPKDFLTMCGHATIATATALVEMGIAEAKEPETLITFDTPAGLVHGHVIVENGRACQAWIENVPSFLYQADVPVEVPRLGRVTMDIAWGGNFFGIVPAEQLEVPLEPANISELVAIGVRVRDAVNAQVKVQHPVEKHVNSVTRIEISGPATDSQARQRNIVVGMGYFDRSPCGTGTSARMATLYAKGELKLGEEFVHESIIGTLFRGQLLREAAVGEFKAVVPRVAGTAYITGIHQFMIDPDDPLKYGFSV